MIDITLYQKRFSTYNFVYNQYDKGCKTKKYE